ncbi:MAG: hypothetical protein COV07_01595 [Candidatus Vogelbacteria bacterium CG10_big_fil_rev_8_21_14_0_10_45_14]|uniref:Uncharacterized protein n=1 Tax=Candidatus Vogelbacteria bacterium CG10_big_fil_rev_8_21_14_0_10_45_14 TaxID=1975042 RepID=A0A2H0RKB7_9BACT|nr:MAG: hypothetical protein COV07_01595 [Candidatus Vogelbacteria bacterium CG10_big_fil_rev_8_21_14_0_10_45_14]
MNPETKTCENCKQAFTIELEDFVFYEKMKVPPPTFCPRCRLQRRWIFRNERFLYNRKCAMCDKQMLATIREDVPVIVYCNPCWWTGDWGGEMYGRDYDPNKNFFEQFRELMLSIPFPPTVVDYQSMIGSEYTNYADHLKNCYLLYDSNNTENALYAQTCFSTKDSMDFIGIGNSELCYEVVIGGTSSKVFFSYDCTQCMNVYFSRDMSGCSYCFGCASLKNMKYC